MSKEAVVFVIDVGKSMSTLAPGSTETGLDLAKRALRAYIQKKLLFTKRDEIGLVLVGTEGTANVLNEEGDGYENVTCHREIGLPSLDFLEMVDSVEVEQAQGDVIDGLLVAMTMINRRVKALKFAKRIFLITDGAGEIQDDPDQMEAICEGLVREDYKLNIIGVGFKDDDDDEDEGEEEEEQPSNKTPTQVHNEKILKKFAADVEGACLPVADGLDILGEMQSKAVGQVTKFRGNLEIGTTINIPVHSYAKTAEHRMPPLLKMSQSAAEHGEEAETTAVGMDRTYWNKNGPEEVEVAAEDRVRSYKYGKQQIPFLNDEEKFLKYESEKALQVLGFYRKAAVLRHHVMSTVDVIVAEPGNRPAGYALSMLIHAIYEMDKVMAVRYVKRKNSQPLFGVLLPSISTDMECLYFLQLPFYEDVRHYDFPPIASNPIHKPTPSQLAAARALITGMDLSKAAGDEDDPEEALEPEMTFNPVLQRFYQSVERRALDETAEVCELDPLIASYINPSARVVKAAEASINNFKANFKFEKIESKKKANKRHWRDFEGAAVAEDEDIQAAKKARADDMMGDDMKFDDIVAQKTEVIASADPVRDFESMLKRRKEPEVVDRAIEGMTAMILSLVKTNFNGDSFPKVVDCIIALRAGCVMHEEPVAYNTALGEWKKAWDKKRPALWAMVVEAALKPIHTAEVAHSTFSEADAARFLLDADVKPPAQELTVEVSDDDDDLWGSMQ